MKKLIILWLFIGSVGCSCGPQGILYEYRNTEIVFGSGGGFTGQGAEYHLDAMGNLTMTESLTGNTTNLGKIDKSDLKKIYRKLSELNLAEIKYNQPGNMYYFIKEINKNETHKVIWGNIDQPVPPGIQEFYDMLIASMN